jgi:hypothetical protein
MTGEVEKTNQYFTKSGAKEIFLEAEVPTPISCYNIRTEEEFEVSFAKLISHNLMVDVWLFKIDDEFNGRGHAYLNLESVKAIQELKKSKVRIDNVLIERLVEVVKKVINNCSIF